MKNLYKIIFLCICGITYAQTQSDIEKIRSLSNLSELQSLSVKYKSDVEKSKARIRSMAKTKGWETSFVNKDGTVSELVDISADGKSPIYYSTENEREAESTRTDYLNSGGGLGLNLNGQNMTAYVWDGGATLPTHDEFGGRVSILDGVTTLTSNSQHSNHVTGTIVAAGIVEGSKGMAFQGNAKTNDWNNDLPEATVAAANGMLISNHSYGLATRSSEGIVLASWRFGAYETKARDWDNLMFNAPYYLMVKSAGNDGFDNTANSSPLGGLTNLDKLTGMATCKNNLVIANGNYADISQTGALESLTIHGSSSQGPTDDLRIKPDLVGMGTSVYSTGVISIFNLPLTHDTYGNATGTSMAAPNVTGTLLLLQQHYKNVTGNFMRAATLKGLTLHTADDAGAVGPDAIFGWGLLNAKFAAETITKNGTNAIIQENTLYNLGIYTLSVISDGVNPLIASLSWTDPAGVAYSGTTPNIGTATLINDLDIRVTNLLGIAFPYRLLTPTTNGLGDNTKDPYERIRIDGAAGIYIITVTHKGLLSGGNQKFSLIVTGVNVPNLPIGLAQEEAPESRLVSIYPNPTSGIFKINISSEEQGTLKITSLSNTIVFEEKTNKQKEFNVNISKQVPGVYIVQFFSDNGKVVTRKIIKN